MRQRTVDHAALRRLIAGRCFICEMLNGNPDFRHHIVYEDERMVAFLLREAILQRVVNDPQANTQERPLPQVAS